MARQQVFRLPQRTSIHDLVVQEEDIPQPGPGEVLIHVRNVALNYRDYAIATNQYPMPVKDNVVPGSDLAGEIESVGSHVEDLSKGDKVVVSFDLKTLTGTIQKWTTSLGAMNDGVLREYMTVDSSAVVKIPETTLSMAQMASIVCTGTTAWNALYGNNPLKPGQTVLFQGTGGVSVTGLILAKAAGATTIITSSSDSKLRHVQEKYGADHVINYKTHPEWSKEVQRITDGQGVDILFENGGAGTIAQSLASIKPGGCIPIIGFLSPCAQEDMPNVALLAISQAAVIRGIRVGSREHLEEVTKFVTSKNLQPPVEKEFGFSRDEVIAALEYLASGQHIGKVCIRVS